MEFPNPYKPGAGHKPPYLAGRELELKEFRRLLEQTTILDNAVLTGLRGVGKTVLLEKFKQIANDQQKDINEILKKQLSTYYSNNEISSVSLKEKTIFLSMEEIHFNQIEKEIKSKKLSITKFFNQILMETS